MQSTPKVFVITLNWNGRQWLEDCLSSVLKMKYLNFEVVMVDNGSTDGSIKFVHERFPMVHVVACNKNLGYARGFNVGLEYAAVHGAEYFLIINNDTVIDHNALSALIDIAQMKRRVGFVTGKIYFYDLPDVFQTVGKKEHPVCWNGDHIGTGEKDVSQYEKIEERNFLDDVMTLVNREVYDEIGGYDTQLFLQCEEFDWQVRAKKTGWKLYYTPKAKMWHRVSMSMGGRGSAIAYYFDVRSQMVVLLKYMSFQEFLKYYLWILLQVNNSLLRGMVQFNWHKINPRLARWLGFVAGTFWLIHRRPATKIPRLIQLLQKTKTKK